VSALFASPVVQLEDMNADCMMLAQIFPVSANFRGSDPGDELFSSAA
jgi:hypothetical protein